MKLVGTDKEIDTLTIEFTREELMTLFVAHGDVSFFYTEKSSKDYKNLETGEDIEIVEAHQNYSIHEELGQILNVGLKESYYNQFKDFE